MSETLIVGPVGDTPLSLSKTMCMACQQCDHPQGNCTITPDGNAREALSAVPPAPSAYTRVIHMERVL